MIQKISFGCDHRGFEIKQQVLEILQKNNYEMIDCGTNSSDSADYPDHILDAAEKVSSGECERAIGVCYSGIGSSIAANKVRGVRAALVQSVKEAELSRQHNNSNMLILGTAFVSPDQLTDIIVTWLKTPFEGGRHERRINKIRDYEQRTK